MTPISCQWLGHTTLRFEDADTPFLLQPFFKHAFWPWKRVQGANTTIPNLQDLAHVFLLNPHRDRLDLNALKFFSQHKTTLYLPARLAKEVRKFFHFKIVELEDQSEIVCGGFKIRPIATPVRGLKRWFGHREMFHVILENKDQRILVLSDLPQEGSVWEAFASSGQTQAIFVPIEKLSLMTIWQKKSLNLETLRRLVDFLQVEKLLPYAYGSYTQSGTPETHARNTFEQIVAGTSLAGKIVWIPANETR